MPPTLRIFLGLLTAYLLVSLFYAHLEDSAHAALRKDKQAKDVMKRQLAQEKHQQDSVTERRHNDLVGALRTVRQGSASTGNSQPTPATASSQATPGFQSAAPAMASTSAAGTPTIPQGKPLAEPASTRWQTSLTWLLPALLVLGLALLAGFGWLGWRERQNKLLVPDRFERDTPLLELLLRALAGPIGRVLPIPRQVKRFASKARLQHNLLHALAKNTQAAASGQRNDDFIQLDEPVVVQFGPEEQVLAILLLLLLEEEIVRESRAKLEHLAKNAAPMYLRETSPEEFAAELRALFNRWHETGIDAVVYERFRQAAQEPVPTYAQLPAVLESEVGDWLLVQLHRLNAGLLV